MLTLILSLALFYVTRSITRFHVEPLPALSSPLSYEGPTSCPNFHLMSVANLRKSCTTQGVQWRNFHDTNRHMTKAEMISELFSWTY